MENMFPKIPEKVSKGLEYLYPPLEYSKDLTLEEWAFRGGQREVISKLKSILNLQKKRS